MKHIAFFRICTLLIVSILVGCTSTGLINDFPQTVPESSLPSATPIPAPHLDLRMATDSSGFQFVAGNDHAGYYLLDMDNHTGQVICLDYESLQQTYWTNQLAPSFDENDPGWIGDTYGGARTIASGDNLYVFKYGKTPLKNVNPTGSPAQIHLMNYNGMSRKTISFDPNCPPLTRSGMATDNKELYLLTCRYDENGRKQTYEVCKTDFEAEKINVLATLDAMQNDTRLVGVYHDGLILQQHYIAAEGTKLPSEDQVEYYKYQLILFSLLDNTFHPINFSWVEGELTCVYGDGLIYYIPAEENKLICYDVTSEKIISSIDLTVDGSSISSRIYLSGEDYGDHLTGYILNDNNESQLIGIDKKSGEAKSINLTFEYNMGTVPMSIVCQTETQFLINSNIKETTSTITMPDGSPHTIYIPVFYYSLIDKNDYWASNPKLLNFEDHVYK